LRLRLVDRVLRLVLRCELTHGHFIVASGTFLEPPRRRGRALRGAADPYLATFRDLLATCGLALLRSIRELLAAGASRGV
jgi:hypothetical protein